MASDLFTSFFFDNCSEADGYISMAFVLLASLDELINSSKDSSRTKAIEMYPSISEQLSKKKDVNKSDAILIARYYSETRFKEEE